MKRNETKRNETRCQKKERGERAERQEKGSSKPGGKGRRGMSRKIQGKKCARRGKVWRRKGRGRGNAGNTREKKKKKLREGNTGKRGVDLDLAWESPGKIKWTGPRLRSRGHVSVSFYILLYVGYGYGYNMMWICSARWTTHSLTVATWLEARFEGQSEAQSEPTPEAQSESKPEARSETQSVQSRSAWPELVSFSLL